MNDPYTLAELEALLPPHPVGEPVLELDVGVGARPHHRGFVDGDGNIDKDEFTDRSDIASKSFKEMVGSNLRRIREKKQSTNKSWSAAATNRMLHTLTSGMLFTDLKVVNDIERGVRNVTAEELIWLSLLFEVPVWEFLVPPENKNLPEAESRHVNLGGHLRDRRGLLVTLTHMNPDAIDAMDPQAYLAYRQRQRAAEKAAFAEATDKLLEVHFEETIRPFASVTGLIERDVKVPEPATPLESDERLPEESEDDYEMRQNEERGVLVSEYEKLKQVGDDLDQIRIGLERAFREAQRELKNSANELETKDD